MERFYLLTPRLVVAGAMAPALPPQQAPSPPPAAPPVSPQSRENDLSSGR